jgi:small-conductance mechanosensitive channel
MTHGYLYDFLRKLGMTDFGASTGEFLLARPARILLILVGAWIFVRVAVRAIRRFAASVQRRTPSRLLSVRAEQRVATIGDALTSLARLVIWAVALLLILAEFDVNLAPLLAGAGIAGIAVGFGAQSLVRDYISGLLILVEDQYGVGDVVNLGDAMGTVEDLNLRVTRVRAVDGTVYFVPNGEIRKVGNSSMEWSRALIDTTVGTDADATAVAAAIGDEAAQLAADPRFRDVILDEPEVWGVQTMTADGVTIRLTVKTAPRQQWLVARELRTRIAGRMRRDGVPGAAGKAVTISAGPLDQWAPVAVPLGR